jgi:hypothetical protein
VSGVVEPPSVFGIILVNLGESNLKIGSVGQVAVSRNSALDTATEIGLTVESLFNRFHGKVGVTSVGYLPKGNLWVARKINILSTVSD